MKLPAECAKGHRWEARVEEVSGLYDYDTGKAMIRTRTRCPDCGSRPVRLKGKPRHGFGNG